MTNSAAQALNLRDIHLPVAPAFWPPAPGWWLLAAMVLLLLAWVGFVGWQHLQLRREHRLVLDELARITVGLERDKSPAGLVQLSVLLRRLVLLRFPRAQVAGLSGDAWLRFLDASGQTTGFCSGPGQVLVTGPYQRALPDDFDAQGLVSLVHQWVGHNSGKPKKIASRTPNVTRTAEALP